MKHFFEECYISLWDPLIAIQMKTPVEVFKNMI